MAACVHCGIWAGIKRKEHYECAKAISEGRPPGRAVAIPVTTTPDRVSAQRIGGGVFLGLLMFGGLCLLLWILSHLL